MYSDNSLTPRESIRLCALGILAQSVDQDPINYDELVYAVRHFVSRITGPSLDLMGESVELLKHEGLVSPVEPVNSQNPCLKITDSGISMLKTLLQANVRIGNNDLNELIISLKFRFFHFLTTDEQKFQVENLINIYDAELIRLDDLMHHHKNDSNYLSEWLAHDTQRLESRINWLGSVRNQLDLIGSDNNN